MLITLAGFTSFIIIGLLGRGRLGSHVAVGIAAVSLVAAMWLTGQV